MKKLLSLSLFVALLCACNSSSTRCLVVDLSNYADLEDNAHFMMLFSNPLDSMKQDTIYWTGDKRYRYEIESSEDFLAFVDVYAIPENEEELNKLLFRTVVAIDGPEAIVSAENRYTVSLSGTPSNIQIHNLRTEQYKGEVPQEVDTMTFIKNYMQEEMSTHQNDLYGAYIYSFLSIMRLAEVEESYDMSYFMFAQQVIEEEKQADTYLSKHNIALPYYDLVMKVGDVSASLVSEFIRYMYPLY